MFSPRARFVVSPWSILFSPMAGLVFPQGPFCFPPWPVLHLMRIPGPFCFIRPKAHFVCPQGLFCLLPEAHSASPQGPFRFSPGASSGLLPSRGGPDDPTTPGGGSFFVLLGCQISRPPPIVAHIELQSGRGGVPDYPRPHLPRPLEALL